MSESEIYFTDATTIWRQFTISKSEPHTSNKAWSSEKKSTKKNIYGLCVHPRRFNPFIESFVYFNENYLAIETIYYELTR